MSIARTARPRRRWTAEAVIEEIKVITCFSPKKVQQHCPMLYAAATRHFGSWKAAVTAAGFDYDLVSRRHCPGYWDADQILAEIRSLERLNSSWVRKAHVRLYAAALRVFGHWEDAVRAAGFDYDRIRQGWVAQDAEGIRFGKRREG